MRLCLLRPPRGPVPHPSRFLSQARDSWPMVLKRSSAKKSVAKKSVAKKSVAKAPTAKRSAAKKSPAKKTVKKAKKRS
jgi:hypothetical protein